MYVKFIDELNTTRDLSHVTLNVPSKSGYYSIKWSVDISASPNSYQFLGTPVLYYDQPSDCWSTSVFNMEEINSTFSDSITEIRGGLGNTLLSVYSKPVTPLIPSLSLSHAADGFYIDSEDFSKIGTTMYEGYIRKV